MEKLTTTNEKGEIVEMEVSAEGNLGLLALGAVGVMIWKKARRDAGYPDFADPNTNIKYKVVKRKKPVETKKDEKE